MSLIETLYHGNTLMSTPHQREIQHFGEKLHTLRTRHHMTLKELASALGLKAHGHLSELEAGKKGPTAEFVLSVARLFHTTTDQLLKDELELNAENPEIDAGRPD